MQKLLHFNFRKQNSKFLKHGTSNLESVSRESVSLCLCCYKTISWMEWLLKCVLQFWGLESPRLATQVKCLPILMRTLLLPCSRLLPVHCPHSWKEMPLVSLIEKIQILGQICCQQLRCYLKCFYPILE